MARFSRIEVAQKMKKTGLIPLFYHPDIEIGKRVFRACYNGGARLMEFICRGDYSHDIFKELHQFACSEFPEMAVGVGSISDANSASFYMQMGADFVVTPVLRKDVAMVCNRRKVLWSAGCGSATEIAQAEELGCEIVKLFPGGTYGPSFVKAIKGPSPWTEIMPTGGVSPEEKNLRAWFEAGVACVGMGSKLISKDLLEKGHFDALEQRVRDSLDVIQKVRQ